MKKILYNELRKIKDSLPHGAMNAIANELDISVDVVKDFFKGVARQGFYYEKGGIEGGIVYLEDTTILDSALKILRDNSIH